MDGKSGVGRGWKIAAPIALALCGLLLITSAKAADGDDLRGSDTLEISDLVRTEELRVEELNAKITDLTEEIDQLAASHADSETEEVDRQTEVIMPEAGLTPVQGPALTVTLDDAPRPPTPEDEAQGLNIEDYLVHQQDIEAVVNALWAGGAEAMTVMDQRIVSTSTIRCVGSVLLLHGRTYYPPYAVTAIGDTDAMRTALDSSAAVATYRDWADRVGLAYDLSEDTVTMPAYTGTTRGGSTS